MIVGYFGLPGCGKTTYLTKIAIKTLRDIKKGKGPYKRVYTNFSCSGCCKFDFSSLGVQMFEDCLILIDEITLFADNRDYKEFKQNSKEFFMLHRHYNCDVIYFTQYWDAVDKKIRCLTTHLYHLRKFGQFSIARKIEQFITVDKERYQIIDGYKIPGFISLLISKGMKCCYRPLYYKYFDSYDRPLKLSPNLNVHWNNVLPVKKTSKSFLGLAVGACPIRLAKNVWTQLRQAFTRAR